MKNSRKVQSANERVYAAALEFQKRLGAFFRGKRLLAKMREKETADCLQVTIEALRDFESGSEGIPLHVIYRFSRCLGISPVEIVDFQQLLEKEVFPKFPRESSFVQSEHVGSIIQSARKTVALSRRELSSLLYLSERELREIEEDEVEPRYEFIRTFSELLHLEMGALFSGYSPWLHLKALSEAQKKGDIRFPVKKKFLDLLDRFQAVETLETFKGMYLLPFFPINPDD